LVNNTLNGTLQANWAQLVNLTTLELSGNQFRGSLPAAWRQIGVSAGSPASIRVANSPLVTGSLPAAWGSFNATSPPWNLALLDITNSALTGVVAVATWLYNMTLWGLTCTADASALDMATCSVSRTHDCNLPFMCCCTVCCAGPLPSTWSSFSNSTGTQLLLSGNLLQGGIPDTWGSKINVGSSSTGSGWRQLVLDNNP
jgi:hypothetical protein